MHGIPAALASWSRIDVIAVTIATAGMLVLFVHDISDIFLDLMKMANYLKLEQGHGYFITEMAYTSCLVSWAYFRL